MMVGKYHTGISLIAISLSLLAMMAISPFAAYAQQSSSAATQWNGPMGNYPFNWDYSAQTQISAANIQNLQVSWIFPIPAAPPKVAGGFAPQGEVLTPLVVNGIVYTITNFQLLLSQDLRDGKILWQTDLSRLFMNVTGIAAPPPSGHYHAIWYTSNVRGGPLVWVPTGNNGIYAFDALTGDLKLAFSPQISDSSIPGNFGRYGSGHPWFTIDEKRGLLVTGSGGTEGTDSGRGVLEGFDITQTPPKLLWRTFLIPPQDGSNPNWSVSSVQNMSYAYIFNAPDRKAIDLKALSASQLHDMLYNDWGNFGFNGTRSFAGVGVGWGGDWAIDPATGIAYVGTSQVGPDWNATTRPGTNLWSASVLAVNEATGRVVWAFQTTPHDLWDFDCSWGVMLANATISGQTQKVVLKGCKNGYFYALDAATGKMYWYFDAPSIKRTTDTQLLNPTKPSDMRKLWANYPSTGEFTQNPPASGGIESNPAYDPTTNTAFVATYNNPAIGKVLPTIGKGVAYGAAGLDFFKIRNVPGATNTTIWAIDVNSGQAKWHYDIPSIGYRGGVTVSNGVLYVPANNGIMYMLDSNTGKVLNSKFIGAALITQPAIAHDSNGQAKLVLPGSGAVGSLQFGFLGFPTQPGYLFAMGLSPPVVQTQTATATATATSLITQTVSTGIDPSTFYGVTALAVIFLIATGVLAIRRRKPAP